MSLILEALRKSEAERRRGQAPDVAMELPPVATRRARGVPAWWLPLALMGAMAVFAAWWWTDRDAPAPVANPTTAADAVIAATADTPAPVVRVLPPPAATSPAPVAASERTALPVPAPPTGLIEQGAMPPKAPPPPVPAPLPEMSPVPAPVAPPTMDDRRAASVPGVKLSMHIWDESPARRFVILNGQRMAEGDRSGELVVVSIERDGVIVERNGVRARVPLP